VEEGVVLAVGDGEQAGYVAVDDGSGPEARAWRRPPEIPPVRRGARVRVTLTRHLRHVTDVELLEPVS